MNSLPASYPKWKKPPRLTCASRSNDTHRIFPSMMVDPGQDQKSSTKALLVTSRDTKRMPIQPFPKNTKMLIDLDLQPEQQLKSLKISNTSKTMEEISLPLTRSWRKRDASPSTALSVQDILAKKREKLRQNHSALPKMSKYLEDDDEEDSR
ncbi:uncharacterized protein RHIMIDRAFT_316837, partial [Rhizopus microsporus ATCC 52813]